MQPFRRPALNYDLKVSPEARARDIVNWLFRVPPAYAPALLSARRPILASSTYGQPGYDAARANDDLMAR